ncbi:hypothetical protein [Alkalimarinus coralli]|uniref:hypothetical protein n=1 Tax=Alkalimarinus coralli TaxID=2935863 RepID=UPI00202B84AE|nr:hypothetical protein [Alkalimarinus coralli]
MNPHINEKLTSLLNSMDENEAEQLTELCVHFSELSKSNKQDIVDHTKLYHSAVQLMSPQ